jgi:hypothetical protein
MNVFMVSTDGTGEFYVDACKRAFADYFSGNSFQFMQGKSGT